MQMSVIILALLFGGNPVWSQHGSPQAVAACQARAAAIAEKMPNSANATVTLQRACQTRMAGENRQKG